MNWLGLDIGGANLKAANAKGWACAAPFALWRDPSGLAGALAALISEAPIFGGLAVTMTGELCDCFCTKAEGVRHILAAVSEVANERDIRVYLTDGRLVSVADALESPLLAAASNWRALAEFACRFVSGGNGLLIDVGSTTSDIIPLVGGRVAACGHTDTERLASRELLYSGVDRTPICAVTRVLPLDEALCPVAAELFSTTADAYLLLGSIAEDPVAMWTADGRPLTMECAHQRLARQLCADAADLTTNGFHRIAEYIRDVQLEQLTVSIETVIKRFPTSPESIVVSGGGEFLALAAADVKCPDCRKVALSQQLGPAASRCAPAFALAVLAESGASRT